MTQPHSKARQGAEIAFAKAQSQFLARETAVEELDAAIQARQEKTARLKKARLAKALEDCARVPAVPTSKRTTKA